MCIEIIKNEYIYCLFMGWQKDDPDQNQKIEPILKFLWPIILMIKKVSY